MQAFQLLVPGFGPDVPLLGSVVLAEKEAAAKRSGLAGGATLFHLEGAAFAPGELGLAGVGVGGACLAGEKRALQGAGVKPVSGAFEVATVTAGGATLPRVLGDFLVEAGV
jgi:hypothetical protein